MPRSGTSLVEQILASHPRVGGAGELAYWNEASIEHVMSALDGSLDSNTLDGLAEDYLGNLAGAFPAAERVTDKMPTNFFNLGLIHAALPAARIIHVTRHPIDTCLSIYFQNFAGTHAYSRDLDDLAHYYRQYSRLMRHWREVLPVGTLLDLPYEGLVDRQEVWTRRLLAFVALEWDPQCLAFHRTARTVSTSSKWQVRQEITRASAGRWQNYANYVGPLRGLLAPDRLDAA